jgi:hypothetical protein
LGGISRSLVHVTVTNLDGTVTNLDGKVMNLDAIVAVQYLISFDFSVLMTFQVFF